MIYKDFVKLTKDKIEIIDKYDDDFSFSKNDTRFNIKCKKCNYILNRNARQILKFGCPICNGLLDTEESFNKKIINRYGNKFKLITPFKNSLKRIEIQCNDCNSPPFEVSKFNFISSSKPPMKCPYCRKIYSGKGHEYFNINDKEYLKNLFIKNNISNYKDFKILKLIYNKNHNKFNVIFKCKKM